MIETVSRCCNWNCIELDTLIVVLGVLFSIYPYYIYSKIYYHNIHDLSTCFHFFWRSTHFRPIYDSVNYDFLQNIRIYNSNMIVDSTLEYTVGSYAPISLVIGSYTDWLLNISTGVVSLSTNMINEK